VLRVSNADKLYNARAILADLRDLDDELWERFNATKEEILWYHDALSKIFIRHNPGYLAEELQRTVAVIKSIAN
jgi:hypothetical protein